MSPKVKENKTVIRQFKEGSSDFWCDMAHYSLNASGELIWHAGEVDKEELRTALLSFIRRNKKQFIGRSPSIFDQEEIEWSELTFGKYKGQKLDVIKDTDLKYLRWVYENSQDKNLIQEIKELLKIK